MVKADVYLIDISVEKNCEGSLSSKSWWLQKLYKCTLDLLVFHTKAFFSPN